MLLCTHCSKCFTLLRPFRYTDVRSYHLICAIHLNSGPGAGRLRSWTLLQKSCIETHWPASICWDTLYRLAANRNPAWALLTSLEDNTVNLQNDYAKRRTMLRRVFSRILQYCTTSFSSFQNQKIQYSSIVNH